MIKIVPVRFLGGLLCAAAAIAFPVDSFAVSDEPPQVTEDAGNEDMMPPDGGSEARESDESTERSDDVSRSDDAPRSDTEVPAQPAQPTRAEPVDREAAKRALLSDPKPEKPNPLLDSRGPDYYDRRAKDLLQADTDKGRVALHPLMQAHPDSYVVVCTGGCPQGTGAHIVSMRPKPAPAPAPAAAPAAAGSDQISCLGGCGPDGPKSIANGPQSGAVAATIGEWMTTVAKVPANEAAPAPRLAGSGDWMDRINRERQAAAAAKAQPAAAAAAATPVAAPKPATPAVAAPAMADVKPAAPVNSKPTLAEAKPVVETKPAVPADAKPAVADGKPDAKPAAPAVADAKPEPKPAIVEAKPAVVNAKPASEAKPAASVVTKPVVAEVKPATQVESKPVVVVEAKPDVPVQTAPAAPAESKPAAAAPAQHTEQKMAALETPKAAPAPEPAKPAVAQPPAATAKPDGIATAPAPAAAAQPAAAKPAAPAETKIAALEQPAAQKPAPIAPSAPKERVISVLSEDKEMNAAIGKARGSLATFWTSFDQPATGEADHALKVAIPGNGTTEHFWLTRIKRDGGKISGVISNQPQSVKTVKIGQRYEFTPDMISDWTFKRNGKLVGNETMRVLLPRMPEEQASVYRQMYETP